MLMNVDDIIIRKRLRRVSKQKVEQLAKSIQEIGLISQIIVNGKTLIAGAHRLEAYKLLGIGQIETSPMGNVSDPDSLKLIEIDENLFRNELSAAERSQQIADRVEIMAKRKVPEILPAKEEAYRKKKEQLNSRPLSDTAYLKVAEKAEKQATADSIKDIAGIVGTDATNIRASIRDHEAVTKVGLDQNDLEMLSTAEYKRVAKVASGGDEVAAKEELLAQINKPKGKSTISHDKAALWKKRISMVNDAKTVFVKFEKTLSSEVEKMLIEDAIESIESALELMRSKQ